MSGRRLVLGTAGHIDHGKTALVRALTGVDTDRLEEEKRRGITIDLGFAELSDGRRRMGVVDVPGHEDFVRTMVAGATGVDAVLLVVAADEGVMPQTREHLQIVRLLDVERLVVALTKADLVEDPEWMALVRDDVRGLLADTPWADAPVVPTSVETGEGLDALAGALLDLVEAPSRRTRGEDDVARLPLDRAFTVKGTGTVVTGTLVSGTLRSGQRVRVLPDGPEARLRGLQVHGREVEEVRAGERTAAALAGVDREALHRGQALVAGEGWRATDRLTVRLSVLADAEREVVHGQRVRVHLGTSEVMGRVVLLEGAEAVPPGQEGWAQLRLERPVVARAGDRLVIRFYSPMTTVGGAVVAEPLPPRRTRLEAGEEEALARLLGDDADGRVAAALGLAGWGGAAVAALPVVTGLTPGNADEALGRLIAQGARMVEGVAVAAPRVDEGRRRLLEAVDVHHAEEPLRPGVEAEAFRRALPGGAAAGLADALLAELVAEGELAVDRGVVARPGFRPTLSAAQERMRERLEAVYREAGLAPPSVAELPAEVAGEDLWPLLRLLEGAGALVALEDGVFAWRPTVEAAIENVRRALGGREGLGPADFKDVLPVSRKHLLPLLAHLDRRGVTVRRGDGRDVAGPAERT